MGHSAVAALNIPRETLDEVLEDWTTADIPERTRAALSLLECMTLHPMDINSAFVEGLHKDGLDDPSIREAANVGFHYNLINRVADAIDFPLPEGFQNKRLAKLLNFVSKILRGTPAERAWIRGEDGCIRPPEVEVGRKQVLTANGETDPSLRRSVETFVTAQWGLERPNTDPVPAELETYLKKLSLHAYKIFDEEFESLKNAGYTDGMLYEITMVGSVGAALVGIEKLYEALYA